MPSRRWWWTTCLALVWVASVGAHWLRAPALHADDVGQISDQERELVKSVYDTRKKYQESLERLRSYYSQISHEENTGWVEKELTGYHLNLKSPYILDMDLPATTLKPSKNDNKANRMFREALDWLNRPGLDREENTKRAEILLQRILHEHKESDKIDEACYYLGEIYSSRYFQMYRRAVGYYERVFLYEADTNLPARLKAANVYEKNLGNSQQAIGLYQQILSREIDPDQTREARRRLDLLSKR